MANAPALVVLTGAGISAESGLRTFRDHGGLWEDERVEDVATPAAFARNPARVQHFYNQRRAQLLQPLVQPNAAHRALAALEAAWLGEFTLITQNVDNLHERAGSSRLLHMHGELLRARCTGCGQDSPCSSDLDAASRCPLCHAAGQLRPHVVWFGELPLYLEEISATLERCGIFIAVGTSGEVYPAAGFVRMTPAHCRCIEVNTCATTASCAFDEHWQGTAGQQLPALVGAVLAEYQQPL